MKQYCNLVTLSRLEQGYSCKKTVQRGLCLSGITISFGLSTEFGFPHVDVERLTALQVAGAVR